MAKLNIGIILGSTRQGRLSPQVGEWVKGIAEHRADANYEIIDIADFKLPFLGEADAPGIASWNEKLASLDGFVFIVQEYNHSITGALKNALDLAREAGMTRQQASSAMEQRAEPERQSICAEFWVN